MEAVYNIFAYLDKHLESNLVFDDKIPTIDENVFAKTNWSDSVYSTETPAAPINMPEALGNPVVISVFVDADHAGNVVTRRSQTGILIYVNNAPTIWYTKKQNTVEAATYGTRVGKEDGMTNLSDILTKMIEMPKRWKILQVLFPKGG
eukprot:scaffold38581_cov48-Attheya_sp.AAC.2